MAERKLRLDFLRDSGRSDPVANNIDVELSKMKIDTSKTTQEVSENEPLHQDKAVTIKNRRNNEPLGHQSLQLSGHNGKVEVIAIRVTGNQAANLWQDGWALLVYRRWKSVSRI